MKAFLKLVTSIALCEAIGIASIPFTLSSITTWYPTLTKPAFSPPAWVFAPVWTILYFLMGIALYLVLLKGFENKKVKIALYYFGGQPFLNFWWSFLFFTLKSPILAFFDITALLVTIALTIVKFLPISRIAAYLLIPYILWVTFAIILNLAIVILN